MPRLAEAIIEMCKRWNIPPRGCADDAIFSRMGFEAGSIAEEFERAGVDFDPARKMDRIGGWNLLRRLFQDAGNPDVPGMYIARSCEYFWSTLPFLGRDPRRVEDLQSSGTPDHGADAARMAVTFMRRDVKLVSMF